MDRTKKRYEYEVTNCCPIEKDKCTDKCNKSKTCVYRKGLIKILGQKKSKTGCDNYYIQDNGNCEVLERKPITKDCKKCNCPSNNHINKYLSKESMFTVDWGSNYKRHFKNFKDARNFAYFKAFYFEVKINGIKFDRAF